MSSLSSSQTISCATRKGAQQTSCTPRCIRHYEFWCTIQLNPARRAKIRDDLFQCLFILGSRESSSPLTTGTFDRIRLIWPSETHRVLNHGRPTSGGPRTLSVPPFCFLRRQSSLKCFTDFTKVYWFNHIDDVPIIERNQAQNLEHSRIARQQLRRHDPTNILSK